MYHKGSQCDLATLVKLATSISRPQKKESFLSGKYRYSSPLGQRFVNLIVAQVKSGLTVGALADKAGISSTRLSQIMYGHAGLPRIELRKKFALILGKSEGYLFRRPGVKMKRGPSKGTPSPKKGKTYGAVKEQEGDVDGQARGGRRPAGGVGGA